MQYRVELMQGVAGVDETTRAEQLVEAGSPREAIGEFATQDEIDTWDWESPESASSVLKDPTAANDSGRYCRYYMATEIPEPGTESEDLSVRVQALEEFVSTHCKWARVHSETLEALSQLAVQSHEIEEELIARVLALESCVQALVVKIDLLRDVAVDNRSTDALETFEGEWPLDETPEGDETHV